MINAKALTQIDRDIARLSRAVNTRVKREAVLAGAEVLRDETRKRAQRIVGELSQNIVAAGVNNEPAIAEVLIETHTAAIGEESDFPWRLYEFGNAMREIMVMVLMRITKLTGITGTAMHMIATMMVGLRMRTVLKLVMDH